MGYYRRRKRRIEAIAGLIVSLSSVVILGYWYSPDIRYLIHLEEIVLLIGGAIFIAYWIAKNRSKTAQDPAQKASPGSSWLGAKTPSRCRLGV